MKILITGSSGFIGKNLKQTLKRKSGLEIIEFDKKNKIEELDSLLDGVSFIYHLAGENRPKNDSDFKKNNVDLTQSIVRAIENKGLKIPILITSSTQAELNNEYGRSKLAAEKIIEEYSIKNFVAVYIYRLPGVFGKWSKPNYNTVIATWAYNITHNIDISIDDPRKKISLVYIDDVVNCFVKHLTEEKIRHFKTFYNVDCIYDVTLGEVRDLLYSFKESRNSLTIDNVGIGFARALYSTYLSFLSKDDFSYPLKAHEDERGSFIEIVKTLSSGQFSISTSRPGITRGNHFHDTKNEKFLVIKGRAKIVFRNILDDEIIEYNVSDKKLEVVDIPPGYTHKITNIGDNDMILVVWANEYFDKEKPDTYYEDVE